MSTVLFTHPVCIEHDTGPHHPECPERLKAILSALESEAFVFLEREEAPHATREQLERIHPPSYVDHALASVPHRGFHSLDGDTILSPLSGEAALRAAGGVCAAVDAVATGRNRNAFCAVRPPGHHAELHEAMGFCVFNNVAIGAMQARVVHGLRRVAVIDFDVHHGNGTQHLFEDDPDLFYASTHQWPLYPGTGAPQERGVAGNVVNAPLPPGAGGAEFREAVSNVVLPALRAFNPDIIMISAGFDAHVADPIANLRLKTEDYGWVTRELLAVAAECCNHRVVSALEGGYDIDALAASVALHVRTMMEC
jgi:acetoin utilization deacetylase AcuC-like enzyme